MVRRNKKGKYIIYNEEGRIILITSDKRLTDNYMKRKKDGRNTEQRESKS